LNAQKSTRAVYTDELPALNAAKHWACLNVYNVLVGNIQLDTLGATQTSGRVNVRVAILFVP
jgi:hypothetical protein